MFGGHLHQWMKDLPQTQADDEHPLRYLGVTYVDGQMTHSKYTQMIRIPVNMSRGHLLQRKNDSP